MSNQNMSLQETVFNNPEAMAPHNSQSAAWSISQEYPQRRPSPETANNFGAGLAFGILLPTIFMVASEINKPQAPQVPTVERAPTVAIEKAFPHAHKALSVGLDTECYKLGVGGCAAKRIPKIPLAQFTLLISSDQKNWEPKPPWPVLWHRRLYALRHQGHRRR